MVDHTLFPYRCDDTGKGGFSDFWNHKGVAPWSKESQERYEKRTGDLCKRLDFLAVDHQVALLGATWDELDSIALRRVRSTSKPARYSAPLHLILLRV